MPDPSPAFTEYREPREAVASEASTEHDNPPREDPPEPPTNPMPTPVSSLPPMVIPAYYPVAAMPEPGTGGAPEFTGKDATHFIRRMEGMCKRHGLVREEQFLEAIPEYCGWLVRAWVEGQESWISRDKKKFVEEFLRQYLWSTPS